MGKVLLILVSGYLIIFHLISGNMLSTSREAEIRLYDSYSGAMGKNIANGGVNIALAKISLNRDWNAGLAGQPLLGGNVSVSVTTRADIDADALEIIARSTYNGQGDSSRAIILARRLSNRFSRFSYFSNREPTIWFYSADTLFGPVHTNEQFHMTGSPVFWGLVSSVSPTYATQGTTNPVFHGGTDFGRASISLPTQLNDLQSAAVSAGHVVLGDPLYVNFQSDGTYQFRIGSSGPWQSKTISTMNGVISCNRNVYVSGTVNGRVTVVSTDNIYITNNLLYADDPLANPHSDDVLGLVAEENVIIQTSPNNLDGCAIQATILSTTGSFKSDNISFTPTARLELLGGIAQEVRGGVGTLQPSGYKKYYRYDERLEYIYPPFFPEASGSTASLTRQTLITILQWIEN